MLKFLLVAAVITFDCQAADPATVAKVRSILNATGIGDVPVVSFRLMHSFSLSKSDLHDSVVEYLQQGGSSSDGEKVAALVFVELEYRKSGDAGLITTLEGLADLPFRLWQRNLIEDAIIRKIRERLGGLTGSRYYSRLSLDSKLPLLIKILNLADSFGALSDRKESVARSVLKLGSAEQIEKLLISALRCEPGIDNPDRAPEWPNLLRIVQMMEGRPLLATYEAEHAAAYAYVRIQDQKGGGALERAAQYPHSKKIQEAAVERLKTSRLYRFCTDWLL